MRNHHAPFLALLAAALLSACGEPPAPPAAQSAAKPLRVVTLQPASTARETSFDGVVEAVNQATVSAQTSGRVVELPYDVGDYVERGAVIVRITTSEQKARSGAATATLAEARARLAEAEAAFARTRDVYERKLVARMQLDQAQADLDSARARAQAAEAALNEAQVGLGHTVITAPYAGMVVARHVQPGETVQPGKALMTGLSLEHLRVAVDVPQQQMGPLRKHRQARAMLPDGRSVALRELRLPPAADPATHSFRVLATLPADAGVLPGTLLKVAFVSGERSGLLLPPGSLVQRGEVNAVYTVDARGVVAFRTVRVGSVTADGRVPVLAGLVAGERVVLEPSAAVVAWKRQHGGG